MDDLERWKPGEVCRNCCGGLPAEGLLGAARLAPSGPPLHEPRRSMSLRDVVELDFLCRGFELAPTSGGNLEKFFENFKGFAG
jgi:hypothetical protein